MTGTTLVTGATGFAGSHLLDRLAGRADVVAWHRPGGQAPAAAGVRWQSVDVCDREAVWRSIAELTPARIVHLAGASNAASAAANVVPHLRANALGTHHVLDAVRLSSAATRVLVVSSAMIYGSSAQPLSEDAPPRPATPYGLSKLAQDELARRAAAEDGVDVVLARPFNHTGPRQDSGFALPSFARQIAMIETGHTPAELHVGNLDARRDLTDVRDVVRAYELLAVDGPKGGVFNICSGVAHRIGDLLDVLLGLSSTRIRVVADPARARAQDVDVLTGDGTRIRSALGWKPEIPIDETLRDTLAFWREQVRRGA